MGQKRREYLCVNPSQTHLWIYNLAIASIKTSIKMSFSQLSQSSFWEDCHAIDDLLNIAIFVSQLLDTLCSKYD